MEHSYIPLSSIKKIQKSKKISFYKKLEIISLILRLNIMYSIQKAGSGHLGSSLSALDIFLCCSEYLKLNNGNFFSSKGHDAPALYNVMSIYKKINFKHIHRIRRLDGPPGHPDINTKNILFNTGSLGMGISKVNGLCFASKFLKEREKNIVLLGDGELQEGQNWESLMFLQNNNFINPLIIIDNNKIQSDTWVKRVKDYSNLKFKIKSFKLNFKEINGHNKRQMYNTISNHFKKSNKATIVLANTIKGKGFSHFEGSKFNSNMRFYPYHSGSLNLDIYKKSINEILNKINNYCKSNRIDLPKIINSKIKINQKKDKKNFNLVTTYSDVLLKFVKKNKRTIVLDADLTKDSGNSKVMINLPKNFVEFGIAEQDMISFGSGLAAKKILPIFHSFSCFLSTRSQEQIFNFCTENRKGIFVGALSGLTPSAPGHSHQMVRDIPLIGSMPNLYMVELFSERMINKFFLVQKKMKNSFFIKLNNSNLIYDNFENLDLPKAGNLLKIFENKNSKINIICQGADVINEVLKAKNILKNKKLSLYCAVWLNKINKKELLKFKNTKVLIFQSSTDFGSFDSYFAKMILSSGQKIGKFKSVSINEIPACGQNDEVLDYHNLSMKKILNQIKNL